MNLQNNGEVQLSDNDFGLVLNHSTIVEHKDVPNHSNIVESSSHLFNPVDLMKHDSLSNSHLKITTYGVFNTYLAGIFNPAFTAGFSFGS